MAKKLTQIGVVELRKMRQKIAAEEKKKLKKSARQFDGPNPFIENRIRSAIREVWQRVSYSRKLVVKRCALPNGYARCEECKKKVPKIFIDHITPAGGLRTPGFLDRMLVDSSGLQGLCHECHKQKTKEDKKGFY